MLTKRGKRVRAIALFLAFVGLVWGLQWVKHHQTIKECHQMDLGYQCTYKWNLKG